VLSERIGFKKTTLAEYIFMPRHMWFFRVVQLCQEVDSGFISGPLIVSPRPKI